MSMTSFIPNAATGGMQQKQANDWTRYWTPQGSNNSVQDQLARQAAVRQADVNSRAVGGETFMGGGRTASGELVPGRIGAYGGFGYGGGGGGMSNTGGFGAAPAMPGRIGYRGRLQSSNPEMGGLGDFYAARAKDPNTGLSLNPSAMELMNKKAQLQGAFGKGTPIGRDVSGEIAWSGGKNAPDFQALGLFNQYYGGRQAMNPYAVGSAIQGIRDLRNQRSVMSQIGEPQTVTDQSSSMAIGALNPIMGAAMAASPPWGTQVPLREKGGPVRHMNPYLVGEKGPEIAKYKDGSAEVVGAHGPEVRTFQKDGEIIPNDKIKHRQEGGKISPSELSSGSKKVLKPQPFKWFKWLNPRSDLTNREQAEWERKQQGYEELSPIEKGLYNIGEGAVEGARGIGRGVKWFFERPRTGPPPAPGSPDAPYMSAFSRPQPKSSVNESLPPTVDPYSSEWYQQQQDAAGGGEPDWTMQTPTTVSSTGRIETVPVASRDVRLGPAPGPLPPETTTPNQPQPATPKILNPYAELSPDQQLAMAAYDARKYGITSRGPSGDVTFSNGGGIAIGPEGKPVAYGPHVVQPQSNVKFQPGHVKYMGKDLAEPAKKEAPVVQPSVPAKPSEPAKSRAIPEDEMEKMRKWAAGMSKIQEDLSAKESGKSSSESAKASGRQLEDIIGLPHVGARGTMTGTPMATAVPRGMGDILKERGSMPYPTPSASIEGATSNSPLEGSDRFTQMMMRSTDPTQWITDGGAPAQSTEAVPGLAARMKARGSMPYPAPHPVRAGLGSALQERGSMPIPTPHPVLETLPEMAETFPEEAQQALPRTINPATGQIRSIKQSFGSEGPYEGGVILEPAVQRQLPSIITPAAGEGNRASLKGMFGPGGPYDKRSFKPKKY